jgi:hypothetical protein
MITTTIGRTLVEFLLVLRRLTALLRVLLVFVELFSSSSAAHTWKREQQPLEVDVDVEVYVVRPRRLVVCE